MPGLLNRPLLLKALSKQGVREAKDVTIDDQMERLSHLHLEGLGIVEISNLHAFKQLQVLYLYSNQIAALRNLESLRNLTSLYVQNNKITEIAGLEYCTRLQKLYLQRNCISVVCGLERLTALQELDVSCQHLPDGASLEFDPASVEAVAATLRVLNVSECGLADVEALLPLARLQVLDLGGNAILDLQTSGLEALLERCGRLTTLVLGRNPAVTYVPKYRDAVIIASDSLKALDGVAVSAREREFLLRFHLHKMRTALPGDERPAAGAGGGGPGGAGADEAPTTSGPGGGGGGTGRRKGASGPVGNHPSGQGFSTKRVWGKPPPQPARGATFSTTLRRGGSMHHPHSPTAGGSPQQQQQHYRAWFDPPEPEPDMREEMRLAELTIGGTRVRGAVRLNPQQFLSSSNQPETYQPEHMEGNGRQ